MLLLQQVTVLSLSWVIASLQQATAGGSIVVVTSSGRIAQEDVIIGVTIGGTGSTGGR